MRHLGLALAMCIVAGLAFAAAVGAAPKAADRGAWAPNVWYNVGDTVTYNGVVYKCIQAHTSLVGWEPPNVPALWQAIGTPTPGGATATRTPTRTNTPAGPTATATRTPTRTNTPAGATATATRTPTRTSTPSGATATYTPTRTNTPVAATATRTPTASSSGLPKHILVGYWHNFDNGSGFIKLRNVSTKFDVINIAFAEPVDSNGNIGFTPYSGTSADEIKSDVAYLHSIGKKVLISIGGQNGQVQLTSSTAVNNFINSVSNIISTYGLDGLDIDFEGHSLYLNSGDSDFTNPTTPVIVNTINAIRGVRNRFGSNFILSMAPETFFVQLGYSFYGGTCLSCDTRAGAYLPVIYATRDILTYIHVQDYNSGPIIALDNVYYSMGNADFHVAMTEMLLVGFPVAGTGKTFPALRQDQVAFGVPATVNAGNGYIPPAEVQKALDYLVKGISFGGSYRLRNSSGYPNLRGIMTWSINWDAFSGFSFSNPIGSYIDSLP